jgi:Holliday junction resolvasome RuvABC endonuclease subunit
VNSRPVCIGIDPSSLKLVAVIAPLDASVSDTIVLTRPLTGSDIVHRAHQAKKWVAEVLTVAWEHGAEDVNVGVEAPVLGRGGARATITQSIVHGALVAEFADYEGVTVWQVNNQQWKKRVVGIGNASKDQIERWAKTNHPEYVRRTRRPQGKPDQDAIDALCIWHSTCITTRVRRRIARSRSRTVRIKREHGGRQ